MTESQHVPEYALHLVEEVQKGRMTRRQLLVRASVIGLSATTIGRLLAACGGSSGSSSSPSSGGKTVVLCGLDSVPYSTLDPGQEGLTFGLSENVYEGLLGFDAKKGEPVPKLAESWEASKDGLTWTFRVRQGIKFHDGTDLDANAVKFGLDRIRAKGSMAYILSAVKSVDVKDAQTVVCTLSYPNDLAVGVSAIAGLEMVSPTAFKKLGDKAFQPGNGAGSGPYMLQKATTDEVELVRFPDYWGGWTGTHAQAPDIGVLRHMPEPAVRIQNLEQGAAQVIVGIPPTSVDRIKKNPDLTLATSYSWLMLIYLLNTRKKPLSDPNLREALYYAYPYEETLNLVYGGFGVVPHGDMYKLTYGWDQEADRFPAPKQDMDKARAALGKSSYPQGGLTLDCPVQGGYDQGLAAAGLFKTALAELKIGLNVHSEAFNVMADQAWSDNPPQDIVTMVYTLGYGSSSDTFSSRFIPETGGTPNVWNKISGWSSPETTKLINDAQMLMATDKNAGIEKYLAADALITAAHPQINAVDIEVIAASSKAVTGFAGQTPGCLGSVNLYGLSVVK